MDFQVETLESLTKCMYRQRIRWAIPWRTYSIGETAHFAYSHTNDRLFTAKLKT